MEKDYITSLTHARLLEIYTEIPEERLIKEARALYHAHLAYTALTTEKDISILSSPMFEILDDCLDVLYHALLIRCICDE